jgi:pilus assembly protein CpaF
MTWLSYAQQIEQKIKSLPIQEISFGVLHESQLRERRILQLLDETTSSLDSDLKARIQDEFLSYGPLIPLLKDKAVTEILVISKSQIWFEKNGRLEQLPDAFLSDLTYQNFVEKVCQDSKTHFNLERPMANGKLKDFRLHMISSELTQNSHSITLRRHPENPWTLERLQENGWGNSDSCSQIRRILKLRQSVLIVGPTGSGKTSLLNACLQELPSSERCILIEDTPELAVPNGASTKLVTRVDTNGLLPTIDQGELVRQSLRMRPDRLVMGEIRGTEAKDFLMALSTGHGGSLATLHASNPQQALLRLEMLVQMGSPQWSLFAIRNLIALSLKYIMVVEKNPEGRRGLQGLFELSSLEENGILLDRLL